MRKVLLGLGAIAILATSCSVPIKTVQGNYAFLKNEDQLNVEFDYSDMTVGKNLTEEEYIDERVEERNKKERGSGDEWKEGWFGARDKRYEPKFMDQFNKNLDGMIAKEGNDDAQYTLIVHTTYTEPGFNIGVMKKPAEVNFEYIFVETDNPENIVARFTQKEVPGSQASGYDFDVGSRVAEAYAYGGKYLAKEIMKHLK